MKKNAVSSQLHGVIHLSTNKLQMMKNKISHTDSTYNRVAARVVVNVNEIPNTKGFLEALQYISVQRSLQARVSEEKTLRFRIRRRVLSEAQDDTDYMLHQYPVG